MNDADLDVIALVHDVHLAMNALLYSLHHVQSACYNLTASQTGDKIIQSDWPMHKESVK